MMVVVLALGIVTVLGTVVMNSILGWDLRAAGVCPGPDEFCNGVYWRTVADYLPTWLLLGQIGVVFSLGSPVALLRV